MNETLPLGHEFVRGVWQGDFCSYYQPFVRGGVVQGDPLSSRYGDGDPTVPESYCGQPESAHAQRKEGKPADIHTATWNSAAEAKMRGKR